MSKAITPTSLATDIKRAIEWGGYLNEQPDLFVFLNQAIFDAARFTIAAQLAAGDYANAILIQSQHCVRKS
jgi:hypothetical protein